MSKGIPRWFPHGEHNRDKAKSVALSDGWADTTISISIIPKIFRAGVVMKRWLVVLTPLVLAGCSLIGASLPEGATQEDYDVCVSQADRGIRNHPSFQPSKAFGSNELTVGLESVENGHPFCSVAGKKYNNVYFMYSSEKDVLLSEMNSRSNMGAVRYSLSRAIDEAHPVCENRRTLETTDDYVICKTTPPNGYGDGMVTLHDLNSSAWWYSKTYMNSQTSVENAVQAVKRSYQKEMKIQKDKACLADEVCRAEKEKAQAERAAKIQAKRIQDTENCEMFAKSIARTHPQLSNFQLLRAASTKPPLVVCTYQTTKKNIMGNIPQVISILGNTDNGVYQVK